MTTAVRRRSLLSGTLALAATQAACSSETSGPRDAATPTRSASPEPRESPSSSSSAGPQVLLAYFSRAGENYYYGDRIDLEVGNTEVLAQIISRRLRELGVAHDLHEIEAADTYSVDYDATVACNVREQDADTRPDIANPLTSIDEYHTVLLASPIWNLRPPMIMHTFADSYDWTGTTVHPITTYAMSGLGTTEREYADACAGAITAKDSPCRAKRSATTAGPSWRPGWIASTSPPPDRKGL